MSKQLIIYNVNSIPEYIDFEQLINIVHKTGVLVWDSSKRDSVEPKVIDSDLGIEFKEGITVHDIICQNQELTGEAEEIDGKFYVPKNDKYPEKIQGIEVGSKQFKFAIKEFYNLES